MINLKANPLNESLNAFEQDAYIIQLVSTVPRDMICTVLSLYLNRRLTTHPDLIVTTGVTVVDLFDFKYDSLILSKLSCTCEL